MVRARARVRTRPRVTVWETGWVRVILGNGGLGLTVLMVQQCILNDGVMVPLWS